ncbi:MAG: MG2 domain-containing protein [Gemmatales bacterium]|nr:MG2 domain-containing protein [Gemmatales bacterium]MDW8386322.1 MG2 domain-containing protein [Gemmatales bacterium]
MTSRRIAVLGMVLTVVCGIWAYANNPPENVVRHRAQLAMNNGNWKDAYEDFRKLALNPNSDPKEVGNDLSSGIGCLINLGREDEIDEFLESTIAAHAKNWRLLRTAAQQYHQINHFGFIVAGKFHRGHRRGQGKYVSSFERDRVRALQLMHQAMPLADADPAKSDVAAFYFQFAEFLKAGTFGPDSWRLQYLTDLKELPDYGEAQGFRWRRGWGVSQDKGAPVDAEGKPIFYTVPESWEAAKSDGQRWRWLLRKAAETDKNVALRADLVFADFLASEFGVQTLAGFAMPIADDTRKDESGTYALHTLTDDETIARLANGIKRFPLPDEFNYIKLYRKIAEAGRSSEGEAARDALSRIYLDRRQYVKAAEAVRTAIREYGPGSNDQRQKLLDQIVGNWGRFEGVSSLAAGKKATVDLRFRNATRVEFEAWEINVSQFLDDIMAYLRSSPRQLDWNRIHVENIGWRLMEERQSKYITKRVAAWSQDLKPRPEHVDSVITITTPLDKSGAYLLTGTMNNGNTTRIILWLNDTLIVRKTLENRLLYFVTDAVTGQPLSGVNVNFFGWRQEQIGRTNNFRVLTQQVNAATDADGIAFLNGNQFPAELGWHIIALVRTADGRLAYLGFNHFWSTRIYDPEYQATKVFTITDRPVYRPMQPVRFKLWVAHARYDQKDASPFAGQTYNVVIKDPMGKDVFSKPLTADKYGGLAGEYELPKDAPLGVYSLVIPELGGGNFRVEEYKKPEFEVKIEAPKEPIKLGDAIEATIQARYYFGSPVVNARVKYKVLRTNHSTRWFAPMPWDWLYGPGYWWFSPDYGWYPGFAQWGCFKPLPWWWGLPADPPEVVMENEVDIGPDGTVKVVIDTSLAKELHGDTDHKYQITAEVTDQSRRTIVGTGEVIAARKPFKVHVWVNRGHYRIGDTIRADVAARTPDGKPVQGKGKLTLYAIRYDQGRKPTETPVNTWELDTDVEGRATQQIAASQAGQFRLSYVVTDAKGNSIEGGYLFVVRGQGFDGRAFRFNDIELIPDKQEYAPGDTVRLLINTNRDNGTVALFVRPTNGIYLPPKIIRLNGKSTVEEIGVVQRDMPNFFVEALTVSDGRIFEEVREIVVPPQKRVLNVTVEPSAKEFLPGQEAKVKVKLTDFFGEPFVGSTVLTIYDRSVEYISGGSNVPEIKAFFWQWRRHHQPATASNIQHFWQLLRQHEIPMQTLGIFGESIVEELAESDAITGKPGARREVMLFADKGGGFGGGLGGGPGNFARDRAAAAPEAAPAAPLANGMELRKAEGQAAFLGEGKQQAGPEAGSLVQPTVRSQFADTALWVAALETNANGEAEVSLKMPENLTGWKVKCWAMGQGTQVGEGETEVVTRKNLIVRLQAPRFFVEKDEVVLSANVHNYLKNPKSVAVKIELDGGTLQLVGDADRQVEIAAGGEQRVDWTVKVLREGKAVVRMKALTDEESDAVEMSFPVFVHGMLKMDSFSGVIRPEFHSGKVTFRVPKERRINETRLEVRWSPTLAGAMVDALPYLVDYPYGCTEQTLNRFLPTVITQNILKRMKLDLKVIRDKRANLNAQEIGDPQKRAEGWKRFDRNPVFDEAEVENMVKVGLRDLAGMQCSDGGWGWFSGFGERSFPHTTAVVVHGLHIARQNGVELPPGMLEQGIAWLRTYQAEQVQKLKNAPAKVNPWKEHADAVDALVYMVLVESDVADADMLEFLYRDRTKLPVYAKALYGLALHQQRQQEKLAMILQNIEQFLVLDDENQTAYLRLPADNPWWYWHGSETEANAFYLKLLSRVNPKDERPGRLVKYLLNNRKHATYWNSTRDTAYAIEALAEYLQASGEDRPDLTVEVWLDGKKLKETTITADNLFTFDGTLVLEGDAVSDGEHVLELRKKGDGPLYFNAYLTNFTLEDFITRAGLEVKVNRKFYKLTPVDKTVKVQGARGQAVDQKVEKYQRTELPNLSQVVSGDLVEVELEIDSKNDYEYLVFEDMKAAGFEPVEVRSGYTGNEMGAYVEFRDERVCFFVRWLARGKHSVSYRLRAEIPGSFSALPARGSAMYAPELKGNSDEMKIRIVDR